MRIVLINAIVAIIVSLVCPVRSEAQVISDYLVLQDIGQYKLDKPEKMFPGEPPSGGPRIGDNAGVVGSSHFTDHNDKTYEVMYLGEGNYASPTVIVTKHVGGDSDKWLLHELEIGYRDSEFERLGLLHKGAYIENITGNRVLGLWLSYRWISNNNVVVEISYADANFVQPEPIEVVNAYLAKFPSILPATLKLNSAHEIEWIKDEFDRRLWLCDKWFMQLQMQRAEEKKVYREVERSLKIFLDYREKYYGLKAKDEKSLLAQYVLQNNGTSIKAKLTEYKNWWTVNKEKSISL